MGRVVTILPRITFGIIVLNGEPFTRYCLRSLYPFAHEILVVEGASRFAKDIATVDGHSIDGTLEALYRFKAEEDPEGKVQIITRDGFWSEKDEQAGAFAERATGDCLWEVAIDEFYHPHDMEHVIQLLAEDPDITAVSFRLLTFWGGFNYTTDGWYLRRYPNIAPRVFRWGKGYRYATHRPPTVIDDQGRNLWQLRRVRGHDLARKGVFLYHYSLVFPSQVLRKVVYYDACPLIGRKKLRRWAKESFLELNNVYKVHDFYDSPSWLSRFRGVHPPAVRNLIEDLEKGVVKAEVRNNDDVERLLESWRYRMGKLLLMGVAFLEPLYDGLGFPKRYKHRVSEFFLRCCE